MHSAVGRGDDARLVKICHMCVPTHLTCIGPLPYYFMAVVLLGGKTMKVRSWGSRIWVALAKQLPRPAAPPPPPPSTCWMPCLLPCRMPCWMPCWPPGDNHHEFAFVQNGEIGYKAVGRHRIALLCPQGSKGRMFVERFTIGGEPFPDPTNKTDW